MFWIDFLFALIVAIVTAGILVAVLGWEHPSGGARKSSLIFILILLVLAIWAGGIWVIPFGPPLWGSYWAPFLVVALVLLLLLAAAAPAPRPRNRREAAEEVEEEETAAAAFGIFFWILTVVLLALIIANYFWDLGGA